MAEYEGTIDSFDEVPVEKQANPSFWRRVIQAYNASGINNLGESKRARDALAMSGLASAAYIPAAIGQLGVNYTDFIDRQIGGAPTDPISKAIKSGFTSLRDYSNQAGQTAQKYWREQGSAVDPESLQGKLSEGFGSIPAGAINWQPEMVAVNAANKVAAGDVGGAVKDVTLRAGLGKAFDLLQKTPLSMIAKQGTASALMGGTSLAEGGDLTDAAAASIMGGLIPIGGKSKPKQTVADVSLASIADHYKDMIGVTKRPTSKGFSQLKQDITNGVDAVISTAERAKRVGEALPASRIEHLEALGKRKAELYDTYKPMQQMAEQAGAFVDLNPIAAQLEAMAKDPVTKLERPQDAKWLMDKATALKEKGTYTLSEAEKLIQDNNNLLYNAEQAHDIPAVGSTANLKTYTDLVRNSLIDSVESAGFDKYRDVRKEYGIIADAEMAADKRIRQELNKIDPSFFASYQGVLTGIEALKFAMMQGNLKSPGVAYGIKALIKKFSDKESGVNKMYKAADRLIEDSIIRNKPKQGKIPSNLASPKAAYGMIQNQNNDEPQVYEGTIDSFD